MTTSPRLWVRRRGTAGPGEVLGEARLLWPGVAQVLPPLDAELSRTPHRAHDLVVAPDAGSTAPDPVDADLDRMSPDRLGSDPGRPKPGWFDVVRIRPSLIGYEDAERLSAEHGAAGMLARTSNWMVALELAEPEVGEPELGGAATPAGHGGAPWPPVRHDPECGWGDSHPGPCRWAGDPWWCNIFCVRSSCDHC